MKVEPKLSWEQVLEQFDNLIKYAARQQVETRQVDNMLSVEDLCQEGRMKLYACWQKWCVERGKDMDEFAPIFRKALFRRMRQCAKRSTGAADIDDVAAFIEADSGEDIVDRLYREESIEQLQSILSNPISKLIVRELVQPSPRTLWEVWADGKRKEQLKQQGHRVNIPKDNTVRMKHIIRALGITTKQYDNCMLEIREKVHTAFN